MKRDYSNLQQDDPVSRFYYDNRTKQTYSYASGMKAQPLQRKPHSIAELFVLSDQVVDASDPDIELSQLHHAVQTAEAVRLRFPEHRYRWFHLVGLLHDLGKVPLALGLGQQPLEQWSVVGDTFPLGCSFDMQHNIYAEYFKDNPDYVNPLFSSKYGIYQPHCGFDKVVFSYGHDEYLCTVLEQNETTLPDLAKYIVRYHSFYAHHQGGAYDYLANEKDLENKFWLQEFQKCDLYSKVNIERDPEPFLPYYMELCEEFLGGWEKKLKL